MQGIEKKEKYRVRLVRLHENNVLPLPPATSQAHQNRGETQL
jgi:hypothetical protein